jgi:hypothetical protein
MAKRTGLVLEKKKKKSIQTKDSEKPMVRNMHIFLYSSEKMTKSLSLSCSFPDRCLSPIAGDITRRKGSPCQKNWARS